jgi:hypothetical protein
MRSSLNRGGLSAQLKAEQGDMEAVVDKKAVVDKEKTPRHFLQPFLVLILCFSVCFYSVCPIAAVVRRLAHSPQPIRCLDNPNRQYMICLSALLNLFPFAL